MSDQGGTNSEAAITFIHTEDAKTWADFLQRKLLNAPYNIRSSLLLPDLIHQHPGPLPATQACAFLISPDFLDQDSSVWNCCVDRLHSGSVVLLLGVSIAELRDSIGAALCDRVLSHHWVQVNDNRATVTKALIKLIEMYEGLQGNVDEAKGEEEESYGEEEEEAEGEEDEEDEEEVAGAEGASVPKEYDDKDVYDYPPPPRQQNSIVRIVPPVLCEHMGLEVMVLMKREAEGQVTMVLERNSGSSRHVPLEHLQASTYLARLPKNVLGKVSFTLLCGEQTLGQGHVHVCSRVEQLQTLLQTEASVETLLCRAMGVPPSADREWELRRLDELLARRMSSGQLPPGLLGSWCCEDTAVVVNQNSRWPTLLHLAADLNLGKVVTELLQYPGMIHAACTENSEGLFPCQLAQRQGFTALQNRLLQFVEDMRRGRRGTDSGILSFTETSLPSSLGSFRQPQEGSDDDESVADFMEKGRLSAGQARQQNEEVVSVNPEQSAESSLAKEAPRRSLSTPRPGFMDQTADVRCKPRSLSDGSVRTPYTKTPSEASIVEEDDSNGSDCLPPLRPKQSTLTETILPSPAPADKMSSRPGSASSETSDNLPRMAEAVGGLTLATHFSAELGEAADGELRDLTTHVEGNLPDHHLELRHSLPSSGNSAQLVTGVPKRKMSAPILHESSLLRHKNTKRSKSVQEKISHFFQKMRPSRRLHSSSETNLSTLGRTQKNSTTYLRQSTTSTSSDHSSYISSSSRSSVSSAYMESERDSGAVCDDYTLPVQLRSKDVASSRYPSKRKCTTSSMRRRQSVRVLQARQEDLSERPTLPARGLDVNSQQPSFDSRL